MILLLLLLLLRRYYCCYRCRFRRCSRPLSSSCVASMAVSGPKAMKGFACGRGNVVVSVHVVIVVLACELLETYRSLRLDNLNTTVLAGRTARFFVVADSPQPYVSL